MSACDNRVPAPISDSNVRVMEPCSRIPIVVREDNLSSWWALKQCLSADIDRQFVSCTVQPGDILRHCARLSPCILAIDAGSLNQLDPNKLQQTIDFGRSVGVLVKVPKEDPETLERLLSMGCMGFIVEGSSAKELANAMRALARGEIWAPPRFLSDFVRGMLATQTHRNLTSRESQILQLISRGRTNRDIAEDLFITRETVRWHLRTLYAKIGVHARSEAASFAARLKQEQKSLWGRPASS